MALCPALGEGQGDGWPKDELLWPCSIHEASTRAQGKTRKLQENLHASWSHLSLCSPASHTWIALGAVMFYQSRCSTCKSPRFNPWALTKLQENPCTLPEPSYSFRSTVIWENIFSTSKSSFLCFNLCLSLSLCLCPSRSVCLFVFPVLSGLLFVYLSCCSLSLSLFLSLKTCFSVNTAARLWITDQSISSSFIFWGQIAISKVCGFH